MLAAVVVLSGSAASAAAAVLVPVVPLPLPVPVPHEAELPVLAQVPPDVVLLHLFPLLLPQVVVESEGMLHLRGRQWF